MNQRCAALRQRLTEHNLDALLVSAPANRRYLSGFTGSAGHLLINGERMALLSDFRYQSQAAQQAPDFEFTLQNADNPYPALIACLAQAWGVKRLGFEAATLTVADHSKIAEALRETGVEDIATEGLVEGLREVKDAGELTTLRRAIAITDEAFAAVLPMLRPEMTELQVAWELEKAMRDRGAEGLAFEIIVASGPNGARPHARAGNNQLGVGQPIVMDFGARVDGYHADMTRTVILGHTTEQFDRIYGIVLDAQRRAEDHIRAGMSGKDADTLARGLIEGCGYREEFGHSLGHGVGLNIHEGPSLRQTAEVPLPAGAVVSVEPGIYIEGWGGVRIEDLVLVREDGVEVLTGSPKEDPLILL